MIFALSLLNFQKILRRYGSNIFSSPFIAELSWKYLYHLKYLILFSGVCYLRTLGLSHITNFKIPRMSPFSLILACKLDKSYLRLLILNQSVQLLSFIWLYATPWTTAHQASLSITNSRTRVYSNSCPLSHWCHPTISSSVVPFSSCPQSFAASGSF